jgi:UDP-N-acetylglucosamine diphosphorylase / glucose-1-phosphate thymidylyltransferase / UDP-N-acetylgalactosamine diphosphorylase / glucosamine-1-phosphate N-acetyltransferase / galactosamine-1-phosphate N-acetyltransferase
MLIVVFEDRVVEQLYPITIGRAAYNITSGSFTLLDWLNELAVQTNSELRAVVRSHLREHQQIDHPELYGPLLNGQSILLVNARLIPRRASIEVLKNLITEQRYGCIKSEGIIVAAHLPAGSAAPPSTFDYERFTAYLDQPTVNSQPTIPLELPTFQWPHEVVRSNMETIGENLEYRLRRGTYREVADGIFAAEGATLGAYVVSDTKKGPILLDAHASVGPYTYLSGPAYIGPRSRIIEHSAIKDAVSIGHTVKVGGEVEASVIEPYTNKQHHGFLGHSYLGSWINLGAGTCNSDLKNTYGLVKMDYRREQVPTNMQFLGCIMGDYAKTAINTGIFTGKTIGACSMVYGYVTTNVPSFVNYARLFGQVTELTPDVMISTQQRMFARRNVVQRPCDAQLLHSMYDLTRHERQLANEPLAL